MTLRAEAWPSEAFFLLLCTSRGRRGLWKPFSASLNLTGGVAAFGSGFSALLYLTVGGGAFGSGFPLLLGVDANARSIVYGSRENDRRGRTLKQIILKN